MLVIPSSPLVVGPSHSPFQCQVAAIHAASHMLPYLEKNTSQVSANVEQVKIPRIFLDAAHALAI